MPKRQPDLQIPAPVPGADHRSVIEVAAGVFKDTCLQLLDQVRDGSVEVIVTKRGEPVARVVPAGGSLPSAFGFMRGTVTGMGDIVSPDHEAWGEPG
jgi:antitoxin (DNA-binding transcriptional repressor) of toxin-antitoxin stability system